MKTNKQRGYIELPNLIPVFLLALVGFISLIGGAVWLMRQLLQHLHWI